MNMPLVSSLIDLAFNVARSKYAAQDGEWANLSGVLSGRFNLPVAMLNIQRQGNLDLLLRCMEDEHETNFAAAQADTTGSNMAIHYQLLLSETWLTGCYEILRAFRQRDREAVKAHSRTSGVSKMRSFKSIFYQLELLRMPIAKFEVAKDEQLRAPLLMQRMPFNGDETDHAAYDQRDPARHHIMPVGISPRGSARWLAIDHLKSRQMWIERRDLADRLLSLGKEITPAGILEQQERAAEH